MIGEVETPARFRNYGRQEAYRKSVQDRFKMEKALRDKLATKLVATCEKKFAGREFLSKVDVKELLAACDVPVERGWGVDHVYDYMVSDLSEESKQQGMPASRVEALARKSARYIMRAKEVDAVFDTFDTDGDGFLSRDELTAVLVKCKKDAMIRDGAREGVGALEHEPEVYDYELDAIIEESDWNKDGKIGRDEAAFAIATWMDQVDARLAVCCVIT